MKSSDNTILITGGGSGIGRALAEAFHTLGNQVIIASRNTKTLDEVVAANPGMQAIAFDITDPADIHSLSRSVSEKFPSLNVLINNAGIMRSENLLSADAELTDAEETITTNLLGPIRLTAALMPQLLAQPEAAIMNVSSGLAFVPLTLTPTYSATKAALHSYTQSLRDQLKETAVQVIELIPPYVATTLMGVHQLEDPRAMPLEEFIREVMEILQEHPTATEVCVKRVDFLRSAATGGADAYQSVFDQLNAMEHH